MLDTNKIVPTVKLEIVRRTGFLMDESYSGAADERIAIMSVPEAFGYWVDQLGQPKDGALIANVLDMLRNAEVATLTDLRKVETTTYLPELRLTWAWPWGQIVKFFDVGEYTIVAYYKWRANENGLVLTGEPAEELSFHGYVDEKNTYHSFPTLDACLAYCIAFKYEGINSRAAIYFMRMVGAKNDGA